MLWLIWLEHLKLRGSQIPNSENEEWAHYHEITLSGLFSPHREARLRYEVLKFSYLIFRNWKKAALLVLFKDMHEFSLIYVVILWIFKLNPKIILNLVWRPKQTWQLYYSSQSSLPQLDPPLYNLRCQNQQKKQCSYSLRATIGQGIFKPSFEGPSI